MQDFLEVEEQAEFLAVEELADALSVHSATMKRRIAYEAVARGEEQQSSTRLDGTAALPTDEHQASVRERGLGAATSAGNLGVQAVTSRGAQHISAESHALVPDPDAALEMVTRQGASSVSDARNVGHGPAVGSRVSLVGLSRTPRYNGKCGVVVGLTPDGKVRVVLDGSTKEYSLNPAHIVAENGGPNISERGTVANAGASAPKEYGRKARHVVWEQCGPPLSLVPSGMTETAQSSPGALLVRVTAASGESCSETAPPPVGSRVALHGLSRKKYNGRIGRMVGHVDDRKVKVTLDDDPKGKALSVGIQHVRCVDRDSDLGEDP